jgi:protein-disulfide isomerase
LIQKSGSNPSEAKRPVALNTRQWLMILGAVVIVALAGTAFYLSRPSSVAIPASTVAAAGGASGTLTGSGASVRPADLMMPGPLGDMGLGDPKAPNVIIEYASMTCPHCDRWHGEVYPDLKTKYIDTGKVYFIFRDFPLDTLATLAIMIAHCYPDRFFPLVDLMFNQQNNWAFVSDPKTALMNLVKQAGIGTDQFNACASNQSILDGVTAVQDRAKNMFGVGATPTFFINGVKVEGEQPLPDIEKRLVGIS